MRLPWLTGKDPPAGKKLFSEDFLLIPWYLRKKVVNLQAKIKIKENVLC